MGLTLAQANSSLFERYLPVIRKFTSSGACDEYQDDPRLSIQNLLWMCETGIAQSHTMPDDKSSRWLGFVQGCLAMRGLIDVDEERNITRPLFHEIHKKKTGETPDTIVRTQD